MISYKHFNVIVTPLNRSSVAWLTSHLRQICCRSCLSVAASHVLLRRNQVLDLYSRRVNVLQAVRTVVLHSTVAVTLGAVVALMKKGLECWSCYSIPDVQWQSLRVLAASILPVQPGQLALHVSYQHEHRLCLWLYLCQRNSPSEVRSGHCQDPRRGCLAWLLRT